MLPDFLKNKLLITFLIIAVFLYATSAKVARADSDLLQIFSWVIISIAVIFTIVSLGTCVVCAWTAVEGAAMIGAEGAAFGVATAALTAVEATFLGLTLAVDTWITLGLKAIDLGLQAGLCMQGAGFGAMLGACGTAGPEPSIYYIGPGSPTLGVPAPNITNQNITAACTGVNFDYTLANTTHYGIYRDGALLKESDTCFANSATPSSHVTYTDNGPFNKGQSYTYQLEVSDPFGQIFAFPDFQKTPCP